MTYIPGCIKQSCADDDARRKRQAWFTDRPRRWPRGPGFTWHRYILANTMHYKLYAVGEFPRAVAIGYMFAPEVLENRDYVARELRRMKNAVWRKLDVRTAEGN